LASSEVEALDLILTQYIIPNADCDPPPEEGGEGDKAGDDFEVATVFSHFAKDLRSFYDLYASQGRCGDEAMMTREQYFKFARDFAIMPRLCTRKELFDSFKTVCGEDGMASFQHFTDVIIECAVIGFSKPLKADVYRSLGEKAKGMVMHLTTCLGREKAGIPMNKYAVSHYSSYDELINPARGAKHGKVKGGGMIRTSCPDIQPSRNFPLLTPKDSVVRFLESIGSTSPEGGGVEASTVFDVDVPNRQASERHLYEQYKRWCEANVAKRYGIQKFKSMIPNSMVKQKGRCKEEGQSHGAMMRWIQLR